MSVPPGKLSSRSLRNHLQGGATSRILSAALAAGDPGPLVRKNIQLDGSLLWISGIEFHLDLINQIHLLAIGKAAQPMADAALNILRQRISTATLLSKTYREFDYPAAAEQIQHLTGSHPIPSPDSLESSRQVLATLENLQPEDLVITLLSGGASALFCLPAEGLSLEDLVHTNQILLGSGADIGEVNTIRKHISRVKGGRLVEKFAPAASVSLILSDVPGNQLDLIGSGPTAPDPSTYHDALEILHSRGLLQQIPAGVLHHLKRGADGLIPETPKPGDAVFQRHQNHLIGSNLNAILGAETAAKNEGFHTRILPGILSGEASLAGKEMASLLGQLAHGEISPSRPACLIGGGETTVTLPDSGSIGSGGRNLELALSAVRGIEGLRDCSLITLATDGEDGTTDAAGGVATGSSLERGLSLGLDPTDFLLRHDSYSYFLQLDDLLQPGSTQTNLNDLLFLFAY